MYIVNGSAMTRGNKSAVGERAHDAEDVPGDSAGGKSHRVRCGKSRVTRLYAPTEISKNEQKKTRPGQYEGE